jgi:chromate transporter
VLREWGRIGCIGFGGPPAHIALLRELCVTRRRWLDDREFEDAIAATNLLPGPASTQLAIYCAWRLRGTPGALVGGVGFIVPGLILILALAALFLAASPPGWVLGAGAGSGAAVAAVAVQAAAGLAPASWRRAAARARWIAYLLVGGFAAATLGSWLVLMLLGCGALEIALQRVRSGRGVASVHAWPLLAAAGAATGGLLALAWVAFKVGALSYGGGFVIIPLMQHDAVDTYQWMTDGQFLNAVALGRSPPARSCKPSRLSATPPPASAAGCSPPSSRSRRRSRSSSSAPSASTACAPTGAYARSSTAPARPRSARSPAPRSRSPSRSPKPGSSPSWRPPPSHCSSCAAASS